MSNQDFTFIESLVGSAIMIGLMYAVAYMITP